MRLNKFGKQLVLVASAFSMLSAPAFAGFAQGNSVTMGGSPVFTISGSADGFSPDHRAWLAQDALDNALVLAGDRSPNAVAVTRMNGAIVVTLDGRKVATADSNSANLEGTTAQALAEKWADGIRSFLSGSNVAAYVAELTGDNPINARVAVLERRIYAPPGTVLPVAFSTAISSETMNIGDKVEGTLTKDVAFGQYVIPAGSTVLGLVSEEEPGALSVAFNTLRTPNGTLVPIAASLTGEFLAGSLAPHPVATENMPYGIQLVYQGSRETACRIPATIGIGTVGGGPTEKLVFRRGTGLTIAAGTPMSIVFAQPQQVAVVLRSGTM